LIISSTFSVLRICCANNTKYSGLSAYFSISYATTSFTVERASIEA
jgi:hypothetical protein